MKRVVNIATNYDEAEEWDIKQSLAMTPEERKNIALILQRRVYGHGNSDVREWHYKKRENK